MQYDHIVIGSGLTALGTVIGLGAAPTVLVLGGAQRGPSIYYAGDQRVPCAQIAWGGLGNYWHGVIPLSLSRQLGAGDETDFARLFRRFYPRTALQGHLRRPQLFVPWRPVRPLREWIRLRKDHGERIDLRPQLVERLQWRDRLITVETLDGSRYQGRHVWIASGTLHTPGLLERSFGRRFARGYVSDHVLCYAGQLDGAAAPAAQRTRDGLFLPAHFDQSGRALYTLRPARFGFRELDYGILQRAAFGLPLGSAVSKLWRSASPGLLSEAIYNRTGAFAAAARHSVYAQTDVADAYQLNVESQAGVRIEARSEPILRAAAEARSRVPFIGLRRSLREDLYIPGIHLHHSVALDALRASGVNALDSPVQIVDASVLPEIGPEHHSFRLMLAALVRAERVVGSARVASSIPASDERDVDRQLRHPLHQQDSAHRSAAD